jgi:hypothetical protein
MFCGRSPHRDKEKESRMTPSEYGNGHSLEHDRMQADVLEWLLKHGKKRTACAHWGEQVELERHGPWAEAPLIVDRNLRGFVDILEVWHPTTEKDGKGRTINVRRAVAYEVKPRLTTIGGLIRQMRAEEALLERSDIFKPSSERFVNTVPVVNHNDPELPLLRRLWAGSVAIWNAEERTLS